MRIIVLCSILFFISSCANKSKGPEPLLIATAANVQFAMQELVKACEQEKGIKAEIILGSSGKLTAQIMQGAPYDIFVSADLKYPNELFDNGYATSKPEVYALGKLVLWTNKENSQLDLNTINDPNIQNIALANPKVAPYGVAAKEFLTSKNWFNSLSPKLVYGESIAQVNQFVDSKTADLGFTSKSVVLSPQLKDKGAWIEIPSESYQPIQQGAVILNKKNGSSERAKTFYEFIFSNRGQEILKTHGYGLVEQ